MRHHRKPTQEEIAISKFPMGFEIIYSDLLVNHFKHLRHHDLELRFALPIKSSCPLTDAECHAYVAKGPDVALAMASKRLGSLRLAVEALEVARGYRSDEENPKMKNWEKVA